MIFSGTRIASKSVIALVVGMALISGAFAFYDFFYFLPHRVDFASVIANADSEDKQPSKMLVSLIDVAHQQGPSPSAAVARNLLFRFTDISHQRSLVAQFNYFAWELLELISKYR